jgi:hypothetical protein
MAGKDDHTIIVELINSKFSDLSTKQDLQSENILTKMQAGFDAVNARMDEIVKAKVEQNGRVGKLEVKYDRLDKATKFWQTVQKRPAISILIAVVLFSGIIFLSDKVVLGDVLNLISKL